MRVGLLFEIDKNYKEQIKHAKELVPSKFGDVKGRQVLIGTGRVDFKKLISQLKGGGYTGDITIEHEIAGTPDRDREIIEEKKYLENIIAEVYK